MLEHVFNTKFKLHEVNIILPQRKFPSLCQKSSHYVLKLTKIANLESVNPFFYYRVAQKILRNLSQMLLLIIILLLY
jgi:hypothetical protein